MAATSAGTQEYFRKHTNLAPNALGSTGWSVSPVGFGCYRISEHEPDHRDALRLALQSGVNLIDTSTNYGDGSSERLVGEVLTELIGQDRVKRENLVVVTKVGYVQGQTMRDAKIRAQSGHAYPDMVEFRSDCWHNISPEFIEEQISRSLTRLRLESIDVLLLHNPEYFLKTTPNKEVYYARIKRAFEHLETEVARGRIQCYGISSNTFPDPEHSVEFTSVAKVLEIAKAVRKAHHFAVIEFPLNLYEPGAALNKNNAGQTVLEFARANKLATLVNRPLNAYYRGRLHRLSSFPDHDEVEVKGELHKVIGRVVELENKLPETRANQALRWGHILRESMQQLDDILAWKDALAMQVYPSLGSALDRLPPAHAAWAEEYRTQTVRLLTLMTQNLETVAAKRANLLSEQLKALCPELATTQTLSQQVIRLYRSLPGVDAVLVGMRQPGYVQDAMICETPLDAQAALRVFTQLQRPR